MTNNIPPTNEVFDQFRDAMVGRGIIPPDSIIADGEIHRCGTEGKPNGEDASYLLHLDGIPAGGFQNWRDGLKWDTWHIDIGRPLTSSERAALHKRAKADQAKRDAERAARNAEAVKKAAGIWEASKPCGEHPYLSRKGVSAHGARIYKDCLVLPARDASGALQSLQFISEDGEKRFLSGGKKRGCYCLIGKPDGVLCVAEGFATGASIHEATGFANTHEAYAVAVAFDAGNLKPVAQALRAKYPNAQVVICADDDRKTSGNPGLTKATEAAQAVGGAVAVPVFDEEVRAKDDTDFNDMATLHGKVAVKAVIDAALAGQAADEPSGQAAQATPAKASESPRFRVSEKGVFFVEDGNSHRICDPLHIVAMTCDNKGRSWGLLLRWRDRIGREHEWVMPSRQLYAFDGGATVLQELVDQGLKIEGGRRSRERLVEYLQNWPVTDWAQCTDRLGWHGTAYVTPDGQIGGDELVVFQNTQGIDPAFAVSGTLDEWRGAVAAMAKGNARTVFSISLAFAGSLAHLAGVDSGGFHLRGDSSSGKSVSQMAASSVWGHPKTYKRSWRATANGLEGLALLHNDGALILDEIKECSPSEIGDVAYMLANGQGKCRANRNGTARQSATWRLLFLSSGELSISTMMAQAGKRTDAGQEIRMADIPADAGMGMGAFEEIHGRKTPAAFAEELEANTCKHHGAVGMQWLRRIVQDAATLPGILGTKIRGFVDEVVPANASGQVMRVARRFALVAVAGELASHYGLTGWQEGESDAAAKKCFVAWLDEFGGAAGNKEDRAVLSQVRAYFEMYGSSRFEDAHAPVETVVPRRTGFWRDGADGKREFLVPPEMFRREICQGRDARAAAKALVEAGWLEPDKNGGASRSIYLPKRGQSRYYVLTSRMWRDDESETPETPAKNQALHCNPAPLQEQAFQTSQTYVKGIVFDRNPAPLLGQTDQTDQTQKIETPTFRPQVTGNSNSPGESSDKSTALQKFGVWRVWRVCSAIHAASSQTRSPIACVWGCLSEVANRFEAPPDPAPVSECGQTDDFLGNTDDDWIELIV